MPIPNVQNQGAVQMKEKFPQWLYHNTLEGARRIDTAEAKLEAQREGWREGYREQEYPKMLHHPMPELSKVANDAAEEEALLGQGYALSPKTFDEEKEVATRINAKKVELEELIKKDKMLKQKKA